MSDAKRKHNTGREDGRKVDGGSDFKMTAIWELPDWLLHRMAGLVTSCLMNSDAMR
jgi:hypothetical protein